MSLLISLSLNKSSKLLFNERKYTLEEPPSLSLKAWSKDIKWFTKRCDDESAAACISLKHLVATRRLCMYVCRTANVYSVRFFKIFNIISTIIVIIIIYSVL